MSICVKYFKGGTNKILKKHVPFEFHLILENFCGTSHFTFIKRKRN